MFCELITVKPPRNPNALRVKPKERYNARNIGRTEDLQERVQHFCSIFEEAVKQIYAELAADKAKLVILKKRQLTELVAKSLLLRLSEILIEFVHYNDSQEIKEAIVFEAYKRIMLIGAYDSKMTKSYDSIFSNFVNNSINTKREDFCSDVRIEVSDEDAVCAENTEDQEAQVI